MNGQGVPLVSIVTPAHNSARYLEDLLCSVERQDYPRIEHIVIDDGSNDGGSTTAVLKSHPSVRWWSRENRGQYASLNEGFRAATGDFITTISADDTYASTDAISAMAAFLATHPECDVVHGNTLHVDERGVPLAVQGYQNYPYWMLKYNLGHILHCSLLVRRMRLLADGLLFDEHLRYAGDGDWMARLYQAGYRFGRIDRNIGAYRHHDLQVSATATADADASLIRRKEREAIDQKYATNRAIKRFVDVYVTCQERRAKALTAWRAGGARGLWSASCEWYRRGRDRAQQRDRTSND